MSIYKPSLLDKFKDFVNGLTSNWDAYEDHVADFDSHQAESSSKHIKESGTNANGSYIRFDDGNQICFCYILSNDATVSDLITKAESEGSSKVVGDSRVLTFNNIPYPASFVSRPHAGGLAQYGRDSLAGIIVGASAGISDWNRPTVTFLHTTSLQGAYILNPCLFAIGRWK